jgi:quinol monooxygenase YgiN
MPVVIELTLTTKPGHYDQALDAYLAFVDELEEVVEDLSLVLIAGEPGQSVIHGVGIYEDAAVAERLASLPFFADMVDALEPHLAEAPQRVERQLVSLFATDMDLQMPEPGVSSLVEIAFNAKLGHVDEVMELHEGFAVAFQETDPDAVLILETSEPGTGRFRTFVLYQHGDVGTAEGESPRVGNIYDTLEPLLADAPRRSELHIVHAFARG